MLCVKYMSRSSRVLHTSARKLYPRGWKVATQELLEDEENHSKDRSSESLYEQHEVDEFIVPQVPDADPIKKWGFLFERNVRDTNFPREEKVYLTNFGRIRFDKDNVPETNLRVINPEWNYEDSVSDKDVSSEKQMVYEQQEFVESIRNASSTGIFNLSKKPRHEDNGLHQHKSEFTLRKDSCELEQTGKKSLLQNSLPDKILAAAHDIRILADENVEKREKGSQAKIHDENIYNSEDPPEKFTTENKISSNLKIDSSSRNLEHVNNLLESSKTKLANKDNMEVNHKYPRTAFDYVVKLRKEEKQKCESDKLKQDTVVEDSVTGIPLHFDKPVDNEGHRVYTDQVPHWDSMPRYAVLQILKNAVLYDNNDILAIHKPYGIAVHDPSTLCRHKLTDFLPELAIAFTCEKLFVVHRLDKETTGVFLLAKSQQMSNILNALFKEHKITRIYWAITKSVPDPQEGILDIPIDEGRVDGRYRMSLRPRYSEVGMANCPKPSASSRPAITYYKTLACKDSAALVELRPETGVRHQLRVHMAFGLNCPILGDHKFSSVKNMAPQKLPGDMLDRLGVRQAKVRTIPVHLHSRRVLIPGVANGKDIYIEARLPKFFVTNLRRLKLTTSSLIR